MILRPLIPLLAILTLPLLTRAGEPTFVSNKITPAYVGGNTDVTHVIHTPDSARAIYVQSSDGTKTGTLYSVLLTGGNPVPLLDNVPGDPESPGFQLTPDGTRVVASSGTTLYSVPVTGGTPTALIDNLSGHINDGYNPANSPTFTISPDSTTVATVAANAIGQFSPHSIFTVPVTGGTPVNISDTLALGGWLEFSADSQTLYFNAIHNETTLPPNFFYQSPADGAIPAEPIVFEPDPGPGPLQPTEGGHSPILLPDGSALIHIASPSGNAAYLDVRSIDLATRTASTLAPAGPNLVTDYRLTHDASHLLVIRGHSRDSLETINLATRTVTTLVANGSYIRTAVLSPDGTTVVYNDSFKILSQSPAGGPVTDLSFTEIINLEATRLVGITPDSSRAVFLATIDQTGPAQLFSNTLQNTDLKRITQPISEDRYIRDDPFITADGSHVIFRADLFSPQDDYLYRVPVTGGDPELLHRATAPARDVDAVLETPDGSGVTFIADLLKNSVDELFHRPYADVANNQLRLSDPGFGNGNGRLSQYLITPDSQHVVFRAEARTPGVNELFATSTTGGPAWRLNQDLPISGDVRKNTFAITPDGTRVVYLFSIEAWQPLNAAGFITFSRSGTGNPHTVHLTGPTPPRLEITTLGEIRRGPIERISFTQWASALGLAPDPAADDDLDNIPLLAEYAFALDPSSSDAPPAPEFIFSAAVAGTFAPTVIYTHPPGRTSTDLVLESSTDLRTWTPIAITAAGANTITLGNTAISEISFPDGLLVAQISLPIITEQTSTVHFRFRVTLARP